MAMGDRGRGRDSSREAGRKGLLRPGYLILSNLVIHEEKKNSLIHFQLMLFLSFHEQISRSVPPASSVSEWRRQAIEHGYLGRDHGRYFPTRAQGTTVC